MRSPIPPTRRHQVNQVDDKETTKGYCTAQHRTAPALPHQNVHEQGLSVPEVSHHRRVPHQGGGFHQGGHELRRALGVWQLMDKKQQKNKKTRARRGSAVQVVVFVVASKSVVRGMREGWGLSRRPARKTTDPVTLLNSKPQREGASRSGVGFVPRKYSNGHPHNH